MTMSEKPLVLTRPYTDEVARANLLTFAGRGDRNDPPNFVGRKEIIERVIQDVEECKQNTSDREGFTSVIQGAPGSGKTSLLKEIEKQMRESPGSVSELLIVVPMRWEQLSSASRVASALIDAYSERHRYLIENETTTEGWSAGFKGTGVRKETTTRNMTIEEQVRADERPWPAVIDTLPLDIENTVFLLLIDEAQNIEACSRAGVKNSLVTNVHDGFQATDGLKIVPVFAGLSDTASVLATRGASRLRDSTIPLSGLEDDETEDLVTQWLQHPRFGFEGLFSTSDIGRVSKMIAVASEGWPRHINAYLRGLASTVLTHSSNKGMTVDLGEAIERGHESRLIYYGDRLLTAGLGKYEKVIRDSAQRFPDNKYVTEDTISEVAKGDYGMDDSAITSGHNQAIHAGILEPVSVLDRHRFKFPIPSLLTYMQVGWDQDRFKERMRTNVKSFAHRWKDTDSAGESTRVH